MGKRGRPPHPDILTPREWQVLDLLRQDLTNEQIAHRLDISPATAKYHVSENISKLGVQTREEAGAWLPQALAVRWWQRATAWVSHRAWPLAAAAAGLAAVAALAWIAFGNSAGEDDNSAVSQPSDGAQSVPSPTSAPVFPSAHDFAYVGEEGAVYLVPADGSGRRELFQSEACRGATIVWSPARDRLVCRAVFAEPPRPISLLDTEGIVMAEIEAADFGGFPGWSPDGSSFAHVAGDRIVLRDAAGQILAELAPAGPQYPLVQVAGRDGLWSPDGNHFAYLTADTLELHIYSLDSAGDRAVASGDVRPLAG